MSGWELDYVYGGVEDVVVEIRRKSNDPLMHAFAKYLSLVVVAIRDVELVLSGDSGNSGAAEAIRAVITPLAELESSIEDAKNVLDNLTKAIDYAERIR